MKLLLEQIEDFNVITESTQTGKKFFIEGVFLQSEKQNRNGRVYKKSVLEPAVHKYIEDAVKKGRGVGTLGHTQDPRIPEDKISHKIIDLRFEGNDVYGKALVLNTSSGKELQALIEGEVNFGASSKAVGSLREENGIKYVQNDLIIHSIDAVWNPSGIDCWVNGIMEEAEWIMKNGDWVQSHLEESQRAIKHAQKQEIEEVALKIFKSYINNL